MVKICLNNNYESEKNEKYKEYFNTFSYPLSDFQKHAIESIVDGQHSLICCPTGSGKTLPAEFAIEYFVSRGKRVIYTSPLKALSNEKFYNFTKKYPHISFGVLTGDIKVNPDADVLIMTAEILLNTLFTKTQMEKKSNFENTVETNNMSLSFEMNFENELGCVIMDEIHFINDAERGKVWEQTLMILPYHIQLIMLSATLDSPEKFAEWIENRDTSKQKEVYLSVSNTRIVPLTHYGFITTNQGLFKQIKSDESLTKEIRDLINKPILLQTAKGSFQDTNYHKIYKTLDLFKNKNIYVKKQHVINEVCQYMFQNDMLPAVLFILSRKQIDTVSTEITTNLLEDDSKIPYIVQKECNEILRKLPNHEEYIELPEYKKTVALLEKGIGIHHSGVIPILREITEILFSKGYIKLLLATETFSVGLNMPIKTTVFTSLSKFDGTENRYFHSHEYMQCSGRAGRRGIDTVGNVIHLNNLFPKPDITNYRIIMNGKPQVLISKFKLSYNLILNLIGNNDIIIEDDTIAETYLYEFIKKSMIQTSINNELHVLKREIEDIAKDISNLKIVLSGLKTPIDIIDNFIQYQNNLSVVPFKKRKDLERKIEAIRDEYKDIEKEKCQYLKYTEKSKLLDELESNYKSTEDYLKNNLMILLDFLEKDGFITKTDNSKKIITCKGFISLQLKEVHCLVFANLLAENKLNQMTTIEIIELFSCFTNIIVDDERKTFFVPKLKNILQDINSDFIKYEEFETKSQIETGTNREIQYDLLEYIGQWCTATDANECKSVLNKIETEKGIFLGEFVKAILKINTISSEMEKIAESIGNIELLSKLKEIPNMTMKYVATNQSLYL